MVQYHMQQSAILAIIVGFSAFLCGAIPMLWGLSVDRRLKKALRQLREVMLQRAAEQESLRAIQHEVAQWRARYYDEEGQIDVHSRKTVLWKRPRDH